MIYKEFVVFVNDQSYTATYRGDDGYGIVKVSHHIPENTPANEIVNANEKPLSTDYGSQAIETMDYQFESVSFLNL